MTNSTTIILTVLGGLLSSALGVSYLLPFPGFVLFSYLAALPLFLLGLGVGLRPLYGAGVIATLLTFLLESPLSAGEFFFFSALGPAFLVNRALLNREKSSGEISWYPASYLLRDFTFVTGFVMLLALGGYFYLTEGGDPQTLIKTLLNTLDPEGHMRDAQPILVKIFPVLPGFFAFSWGIMMLVNGVLAQGLLVRFNRNLRPSPSLENLSVPKSFLIAFALFFLLSFVGVGHLEILGKNGAFVLAFPFFLVGLGLVHRWLHKTSYALVGLTLFYFLLGLFLWPIVFVILLGILKPWIEKSA
ncbi:MAG: hypothetical protein HYX35_03575 [Proteobacteria bacterium]|nr:hypothetical protein [Pseudomonadota bacterium]